MRQEIKTMSVPSDPDIYFLHEVKNDQPVDLRVRSAIQRGSANNNRRHQEVKEKQGKNLILASLLTRTSSPTTRVKYSASPHPYSFPRIDQNTGKNPLSMKNVYLHGDLDCYEIPQPPFQDSKRGILDKLNIKRGTSDKISRYKTWTMTTSQEPNVRNSSNSFHNFNNIHAQSTSFNNLPNNIKIKVEPNTSLDKEFVPNYRKFYSRYSNQSPISRTSSESATQGSKNTNFDSCSIIRERLNRSTVIQPPQSSWKYPGYCPTGHLYRLLKQGPAENNTQSLKRKLSYPLDAGQNDASKNKTLRCLLSAGKRLPPTNTNPFQGSSFQQDKPREYYTIKTEIKIEPCFDEKDEIQITYPESIQTRYRQETAIPSHVVYCPQVIRAVPGNVLKGLLVSNCKTTASTPTPTSILSVSRPTSILAAPRTHTIFTTSGPPTILAASRPPTILAASRPPSIMTASRPRSILPASRPPSIVPTSRPSSIVQVSRPPSILPAADPTNILPASGPPSSGSPGSESTSSGSTDSGVFSDSLTDDRRRVARVLSGRHVKSGTGASITTLRLLRQMIIDRQNRTDRKL